MRTGIGIARVSKSRDNETSLDTQAAEIRAHGKAHGINIIDVLFEDGVSAYKPGTKRPVVEEAFRRIGNGEADTLVVWKLDRFLRQGSREFHKYWERLTTLGGEFASVKDQFDTTTPVGVIILTIILELARMESMARSDRATSWHDGRNGSTLERAFVLPPVGPRPYGYDRKPNTLVVNEREAKVVRKLANMAVASNGNLAALRRYVDEHGIIGTRSVALTDRGIKTMLINPVLAGYRIINDAWVPGEWEGIISLEQSQALIAIFADSSRKYNHTGSKPVHFLSTIMTCACGGRMRTKALGKARKDSGRRRYVCRTCYCSIDMESADKTVGEAILSKLDRKAWKALKMGGRTAATDVTARVQREQEELAQMLKEKVIGFDEWKAMRSLLNEALAEAATRQAVELPDVDDLAKAWPAMTNADKRMIATAVVAKLTIGPTAPGLATHDRITLEWA